MYQDTDFGKDVLAGVTMEAEAENIRITATTAHKPTDMDFTAARTKLRDAKCDLIVPGTIVRDTTIMIGTVKKSDPGDAFDRFAARHARLARSTRILSTVSAGVALIWSRTMA